MVAKVKALVRRGAYYDSVVLMQLQKSLMTLPAVLDAGVVMGTDANKQMLQQSDLLTQDAQDAHSQDLIISVRAESDAASKQALERVDSLLVRRIRADDAEFRPRSLESAAQMLPSAQWVLVSVAGRYAAGVARDALSLHRNVFLYSDNVPLEEEIALKQSAAQQGLLVMGPDCGTAIVNGASLGFANRVRRGRIGVVGASGTGLQAVTVHIHNLGAGISQALGCGTHDLSDAVGAITTRQALELLRRDPSTDVIVLVSKPPSPSIAASVLDAARAVGKPVVADFIGYTPEHTVDGYIHFARTLSDAATHAVALLSSDSIGPLLPDERVNRPHLTFAPGQRYLRGLYSGGTLAYEAQLLLREYLNNVYSNAPLEPAFNLPSSAVSQANTILDLGADEFTVGRLHPLLDNDLRLRRLRQEAEDPAVALVLLDVVLGYGTHPDPAAELAPAIFEVRERAHRAGRTLGVIAIVVGTEKDPQHYASQVQRLGDAGARVESDPAAAVRDAGALIQSLGSQSRPVPSAVRPEPAAPVAKANLAKIASPDFAEFARPFAAINVGLESFYDSVKAQEMPAIQVDWRPPAGGNEKLIGILERLKSKA